MSRMTEDQLQDAIIEAATYQGWLVYHTYDSRKSMAGFPDLCMVRNGRVIFAELKKDGGKLSEAQLKWKGRLDEAVANCVSHDYAALMTTGWPEHGILNFQWWPDDWLSGRIEKILKDERG